MTAITQAVIETGLLPKEHLEELKRWGFFRDLAEGDLYIAKDEIRSVISKLQEALSDEDTVAIRDTDLDVIHNYLGKKKNGKLYLSGTDAVAVEYSVTDMGEVVIPWTHDDSFLNLVMDPRTFLKPARGSGMKKTFFSDARELFFGDKRAFVVCTPAKVVK